MDRYVAPDSDPEPMEEGPPTVGVYNKPLPGAYLPPENYFRQSHKSENKAVPGSPLDQASNDPRALYFSLLSHMQVVYEARQELKREAVLAEVKNARQVIIEIIDGAKAALSQVPAAVSELRDQSTPTSAEMQQRLERLERQNKALQADLDELLEQHAEACSAIEGASDAAEFVGEANWWLGTFSPAMLKICLATVVGAGVGAPIGALLTHDSIANEVVKAGVETFFGSAVEEVLNPASELLARRAARREVPGENNQRPREFNQECRGRPARQRHITEEPRHRGERQAGDSYKNVGNPPTVEQKHSHEISQGNQRNDLGSHNFS